MGHFFKLRLLGLLPGLLWLAGCVSSPMPAAPAPAAPQSTVELIPFQIGVSTYTVEKMAKERACTGGLGAGLITDKGPVEVYRMRCDNGKVFLAKCTLRQCEAM